MKLRTVTAFDLVQIDTAIGLLRYTRKLLRRVGARKSASYVQRALKSTEGAMRHAQRAAQHSEV